MDDNITRFGEMVEATEKMAGPWRDTVWKLVKALIVTNICWALVFILFLFFAYMTPSEMVQGQDFDGQTQSQSYSEGVTHSD